MKNQVDYIIVGQGLAGSLLAWRLLQAKQRIHIIDNQHFGSSSAVAAGVINPITGRRFVKSWMFDDLLATAKNTYQELESVFDTPLFHQTNILRILFNQQEENEWLSRSADPSYTPYMIDEAIKVEYEGKLTKHFSMGELQSAAQVDIPLLIQLMRKHFEKLGVIADEKLNYSYIYTHENGVDYKNLQARKMIFCEGQQARFNPFFNYLPFVPAKGEALIVRISDADFSKMLKHRIFLVPLKDNLYWVGSSYEWDFKDELPSSAVKLDLEAKLQAAINVPFEIVAHRAAIRPTVKDRRPFLGAHPDFPELVIFNGLGTKGASLAPYWSQHLVDYLVEENTLDEQVNIQRFS